jgi:hypothetical protein
MVKSHLIKEKFRRHRHFKRHLKSSSSSSPYSTKWGRHNIHPFSSITRHLNAHYFNSHGIHHAVHPSFPIGCPSSFIFHSFCYVTFININMPILCFTVTLKGFKTHTYINIKPVSHRGRHKSLLSTKDHLGCTFCVSSFHCQFFTKVLSFLLLMNFYE